MPDIPNPLPALPVGNPVPAPVHPAIQSALDADHLRLLEIGFYISGVLTALRFVWFALIGVFLPSRAWAALLPHGPIPA